MEHYGINLKEFLLNSRALNNYPAYAEKEQRFSTLHEAQAIDIALGIAKGMAYLQSLSVILFIRIFLKIGFGQLVIYYGIL
jgi:hypothetical protein